MSHRISPAMVVALVALCALVTGATAVTAQTPTPAALKAAKVLKVKRVALNAYLMDMRKLDAKERAIDVQAADAMNSVSDRYTWSTSGESLQEVDGRYSSLAENMSHVLPPAALVAAHVALVGAMERKGDVMGQFGSLLVRSSEAADAGNLSELITLTSEARTMVGDVTRSRQEWKERRLTWRLRVTSYAISIKLPVPAWVRAV